MAENMPTLEECREATSNAEYKIGEGRDRVGYHIPGSRWVYKVQHYSRGFANAQEYDKYVRISAANYTEVMIPEMHLLENGVIASEFIDGDEPDYHNDEDVFDMVYRLENKFGLYDSSASCNIRVVKHDDGSRTVYVIDLAS